MLVNTVASALGQEVKYQLNTYQIMFSRQHSIIM